MQARVQPTTIVTLSSKTGLLEGGYHNTPTSAHHRNTKYSLINHSVQTRAENWARVCFFVFKA